MHKMSLDKEGLTTLTCDLEKQLEKTRENFVFYTDADDPTRKKPLPFVIVVTYEQLIKHYHTILNFSKSLEEQGFYLEIQLSEIVHTWFYIKLYASKSVLRHFAELYEIDLMCDTQLYIPPKDPEFNFMATELTKPNPSSEVYKRAPFVTFLNGVFTNSHKFSKQKPVKITSAEAIMIVHKVLSSARFGNDVTDYGINNLMKRGVLEDAYPLHDGNWEWTEEGSLTDRQLLNKYWASANCWYKQQPLDLIQKFYGTEVAFYFAWLGFYTKMLIPASIVGLLCFVYGLATIPTFLNMSSEEICNSDKIICPKCYKHCKYSYLKESCLFSVLTHLCDNEMTILFAVLMSFWATVFVQLWNRKQAVLQLRWNVVTVETDTSDRMEYINKVKTQKLSLITNQMELYVPFHIKCYKYAVTVSAILFLMVLVVVVSFGIMIYHMALIYMIATSDSAAAVKSNVMLIGSVAASVATVIFIIIFGMVYKKIAVWLTEMENPRTQSEYENSYIYKSYALSFVTNYATTFYIAFFKGKFFIHPGHSTQSVFVGIQQDVCDPAGCIVNLCIQLISVVVIKYVFENVIEVVLPFLKISYKKYKSNVMVDYNLPIWERDYILNRVDPAYLIQEYTEMVIQYGYVIFFVAAFPLAPLLAFMNNLAEIRIDAQKFLLNNRRPVPRRVSGIGAWNGILQFATYLGIITNAFVIAFTTEFVPRELYRFTGNYNLRGFVNSTLSVFDMKDFPRPIPRSDMSICFYSGKRYPPGHRQQYQLRNEYWIELLVRFVVVLIFEHAVMILTGILAYSIPDIPHSVRAHLIHQQSELKKVRKEAMTESFLLKRREKKSRRGSFEQQTAQFKRLSI